MADIEPAAATECATCRFFVRIGDGGGTCRRYPPTAILIGMAPPRLANMPPVPMINTFPVQVPNDYWCGEHVPGLAPQPLPMAVDLKKIDFGAMMQPQDLESVLVDHEDET